MKPETNAKLNQLAHSCVNNLKILRSLESDLLDRFPRSIPEFELDYEKATESLWDAAVALSNLTDDDQRDLSFYGTENLDK